MPWKHNHAEANNVVSSLRATHVNPVPPLLEARLVKCWFLIHGHLFTLVTPYNISYTLLVSYIFCMLSLLHKSQAYILQLERESSHCVYICGIVDEIICAIRTSTFAEECTMRMMRSRSEVGKALANYTSSVRDFSFGKLRVITMTSLSTRPSNQCAIEGNSSARCWRLSLPTSVSD